MRLHLQNLTPKIYFSPPYYREIWHYQHANIHDIKFVILLLDWEKSFANTSVYEKVVIFKKTVKGA